MGNEVTWTANHGGHDPGIHRGQEGKDRCTLTPLQLQGPSSSLCPLHLAFPEAATPMNCHTPTNACKAGFLHEHTAPSWCLIPQLNSYWLYPGGQRYRLCLKILILQVDVLCNFNTATSTKAPGRHKYVTAPSLALCKAAQSPNRLPHPLRGRKKTMVTRVLYCRTSD